MNIDFSSIEKRAKSIESFRSKILKKGYWKPLQQMTDLAGVRVVLYHREDVTAACDMLKGEFEVDTANSVDKAEGLDPDRFGYQSVQLVLRLSQGRRSLPEWKRFADLQAEAQVRTVLQHAWSAIDHKLRYKTTHEVPRTLQRRLFRLSALLGLADDEFSNIRQSSDRLTGSYVKEFGRGEYDAELNLDSLTQYLVAGHVLALGAELSKGCGFRAAEEADLYRGLQDGAGRLFRLLRDAGVTTVAEFRLLLNAADKWGKGFLTHLCERAKKEGFVPFDLPVDVVFFLTLYATRKILTPRAVDAVGYYHPPLIKALKAVAWPDARLSD